jgi:chromosome segregation protein
MDRLEARLAEAGAARERAEAAAEQARERLAGAERELQDARRDSARVGAELAAANQFLGTNLRADLTSAPRRSVALSEQLSVRDGYELALAAALGGRLDAAVVKDVAGAQELLDGVGPDGGMALLADVGRAGARRAEAHDQGAGRPVEGALRLLDLLSGPPEVLELAARLLFDAWVVERLEDLPGDFGGIAATPAGRVWFASTGEVRQLTEGGTERVLARRNERERLIADTERSAQAEHAARVDAEAALEQVHGAERTRVAAEAALREAERAHADAEEAKRRTEWLIEQRRSAPAQGPVAVRKAELEGELAAELRQAERVARERAERTARSEHLRAQHAADIAAVPLAERLAAVLARAGHVVGERVAELEEQLAHDHAAGEEMAAELRACAEREAEIQASLRSAGELVTEAEVAAQRLRDQAGEAELELRGVAERLGLAGPGSAEEPVAPAAGDDALDREQAEALLARVERLRRRREQLGPVNPLAQEEYGEALAHVEELESRRIDLETALRELNGVIRETDRQIHATFEETFAAAARNFEELVGDVFPGGSGRLSLVAEERAPRAVLGGQPLPDGADAGADAASEAAAEAEADAELERQEEEELLGVEIEITPAGKSTKRLSLLSGGEKSMTALAFLFAVFLARPCPFYILDEVEAALDDINLDRFLALLRRYSDRAQFIVITHQKRTMEAADWLYGVSMGGDGVSKVLSRRLPAEQDSPPEVAEVA